MTNQAYWLPILPSFGVQFEFLPTVGRPATSRRAFAGLLLDLLAGAGAFAQETPGPALRPSRVAILVYEDAALIDFAGPHDVLAHAGEMFRIGGRPAFEVFTIAPAAGAVKLTDGMRIMPDHVLKNAPLADIVILPGGAHDTLLADSTTMAGLDRLLRKAQIRMAVCNAAVMLGTLGHLDGVRATSSANEGLRRRIPNVRVVEGVRVVDEGSIVTTGTGTAGIDGALVIVARLLGRDQAQMVAEHLAYDWQPDETAPPDAHVVSAPESSE